MSREAHHGSRKEIWDSQSKPRVGVPWRTAREEAEGNQPRIDNYLHAVREAGGEPVLISLQMPRAELDRLMATLDAFVLPGSPADVDPARYGAQRHAATADPDPLREQADYALLDHAFSQKKPVLAICYGVQLLNVYLGGTLVQDIPSELGTQIRHDKKGLPPGSADPQHLALIAAGSKIAQLARAAEAEVNSSHHQAIRAPGRRLRVTARAPDGVIEAVEWTGDGSTILTQGSNCVIGVQWHPERMASDFTAALFRELIAAAHGATVRG